MAALSISARNVKAHYRMASALLALNKLSEAAAACTAGLLFDSNNASLKALQKSVQERQAAQEAKERKKQQEAQRTKNEAAMVSIALKARQIRTRYTGQPPQTEDGVIKLRPDPLSPTSTLVFPVVVLYPLDLQSDFIKSFGEEESLHKHLEYLLPLPWDELGEYTVKEVDAYLSTAEGGLIKWGKRVELLKVLSGGRIVLVDGLVKVYLVPKARAAEWIETFKTKNAE